MRMLFSLRGYQAKLDHNVKSTFASVHQIIGTKIHGIVLGTIVGMYQSRKIILPVLLFIGLQCTNHVDKHLVESLTLAVSLRMIRHGSHFADVC